jgi:hypothetical protein
VVTELYLLLFRKVGEFKSERGGKSRKKCQKGRFWGILVHYELAGVGMSVLGVKRGVITASRGVREEITPSERHRAGEFKSSEKTIKM